MAKETPSERERIYICDFRRCRLNVRGGARIQLLLPGHKYRFFLFGCVSFAYSNPESLFIILAIKAFIPRLAVDKFRMVFGIDDNLFFIQSMIAREHIADGDSD